MIQKLPPKPPHHKLGDALFFAVSPWGHKRLAQNRQFGSSREKVGGQKPEWGRGHGNGPSISHDVTGLSFWIRIEASRLQACVADELANLRRGLQDGVR